ASGPGDQNQSPLGFVERGHGWRQVELLDSRNSGRDEPKHGAGAALLAEEVDPKAGLALHLVGEVDVAGFLEGGPDSGRSDRPDEVVEVSFGQRAVSDALELAVDPEHGRRSHGEVEIGAAAFGEHREKSVDPICPDRDNVDLADLDGLFRGTWRGRLGSAHASAGCSGSRNCSKSSLRVARSYAT